MIETTIHNMIANGSAMSIVGALIAIAALCTVRNIYRAITK